VSFSAPSPPDPYQTANAQEGLNRQTAIYQAEMNNVDQTTPYGSLTYTRTGTNPDGTPIFTANTQYTPAVQNLFNTDVGTQTKMANAANELATNLGSSLSSAPNLGNDALVNEMMGWQNKYMQPIFDQQQAALNSQLANEGIAQGSDAYNNAQNLFSRNVNNAYESALANDEPLAYEQALQSYQAPIQTLGTLLGEAQPTSSVSGSLISTPQEQIQPADLESLVQQNYQSQLQNYQNTMSGLFSIPSAVLGGWARSGFAMPSDRRLKRDIDRVGWLNDGTPIYRFRYLNDPAMHIGVMAQDIKAIKPEAVFITPEGFMLVDYEIATNDAVRRANA
jgi:hypothetical protein